MFLLVVTVVVALAFDFTNGFHDTANAVATSVSTRALSPRLAVRELEDEGDRLSREAVADLFRSGRDALTIIRWKDIHEQIEEAIDACENVADVLEAILVKNL